MTNDATTGAKSRNTVIVRTSIIGILANVLLAAFKAVVGLASSSIAIVMDAVNRQGGGNRRRETACGICSL